MVVVVVFVAVVPVVVVVVVVVDDGSLDLKRSNEVWKAMETIPASNETGDLKQTLKNVRLRVLRLR